MTLPPLTYLSLDPVSAGVGLSQVVRYVERLGCRGLQVTLHSFEQDVPGSGIAERLLAAGVRWRPHRFRVHGSAGGLFRVAQGASLVAGADLVHARSDMAAASSLVARRNAWVWDHRAFWREQRMAIGQLRPGSLQDRVMQSVEVSSARSCTGIITLTKAAVDVLAMRYGDDVAAKATVIPTCTDLELFAFSPFPNLPPVRLLLAGTLSGIYDVPTMLRFVEHLSSYFPAELTILAPGPTPWDDRLGATGHTPRRAESSAMPGWMREHHVGLSILKDVGISNRGAVPTKLGEFLASGRPVVLNAGVGDMDELLSAHDCGVVVRGPSERELVDAAQELVRLLEDPGTAARCRALATEHFDLERGVDQLMAVYRQALA